MMKLNFWNVKPPAVKTKTAIFHATMNHGQGNVGDDAERHTTQHHLVAFDSVGHSSGFYVWIVALSILVTINSYLSIRGRIQLEQHQIELQRLKRFIPMLEQHYNNHDLFTLPFWERSSRTKRDSRTLFHMTFPSEYPQVSQFRCPSRFWTIFFFCFVLFLLFL